MSLILSQPPTSSADFWVSRSKYRMFFIRKLFSGHVSSADIKQLNGKENIFEPKNAAANRVATSNDGTDAAGLTRARGPFRIGPESGEMAEWLKAAVC